MLVVGSVVMGVADVARATAFWTAALGYRARQPGDDTFVILLPRSGPGPQVALDPSETPVQSHPRPPRLYADDQAAEAERLTSPSAAVDWDGYGPDSDFVAEDTEGNCSMSSTPRAMDAWTTTPTAT
ncbi:MAG: VOC family protein [Ilumatobacteraceae bacterium]